VRGNRRGSGGPAARPLHPTVDRHDDEHDLPAGLAEQVHRVGGAEDGAEEDREEQSVADDAHRPGPHLAAHAANGARDAEDIADDLPPEDRLGADLQLGVEQPVDQGHRHFFPGWIASVHVPM
jgi:hypothetical protein